MATIEDYLVFIILIALLIHICIANKFADIAAMKGHESGYWGWCFLFGPIGWLMVIALPDLHARHELKNEEKPSTENPAVVSEPEEAQPTELRSTEADKTEVQEQKDDVSNLNDRKPLSSREALLLRILIYIVLVVAGCYVFV